MGEHMSEGASYASPEIEDQVVEAMARIRAEVETITRYYHDATDWPSSDDDAVEAIKLGHRLMGCAINSRVGTNLRVGD